MGGTRISVTIGNSLLEYEEDIEVLVGGNCMIIVCLFGDCYIMSVCLLVM